MSTAINIERHFLPFALLASRRTRLIAHTVDRPCWNAYWQSARGIGVSLLIRSAIMCSITLPMQSNRHTGLYDFAQPGLLGFGTSANTAVFHLAGNTALHKHQFSPSRITSPATSQASFTTSGVSPSGPGDFPDLSFPAAAASSAAVNNLSTLHRLCPLKALHARPGTNAALCRRTFPWPCGMLLPRGSCRGF